MWVRWRDGHEDCVRTERLAPYPHCLTTLAAFYCSDAALGRALLPLRRAGSGGAALINPSEPNSCYSM